MSDSAQCSQDYSLLELAMPLRDEESFLSKNRVSSCLVFHSGASEAEASLVMQSAVTSAVTEARKGSIFQRKAKNF